MSPQRASSNMLSLTLRRSDHTVVLMQASHSLCRLLHLNKKLVRMTLEGCVPHSIWCALPKEADVYGQTSPELQPCACRPLISHFTTLGQLSIDCSHGFPPVPVLSCLVAMKVSSNKHLRCCVLL